MTPSDRQRRPSLRQYSSHDNKDNEYSDADTQNQRLRMFPSAARNSQRTYAEVIAEYQRTVPYAELRDIYDYVATTEKMKGRTRKQMENSVRHNLSQNIAFEKVDPASCGGKKNVWRLDPSHNGLVNKTALFRNHHQKPKRRRSQSSQESSTSNTRRMRRLRATRRAADEMSDSMDESSMSAETPRSATPEQLPYYTNSYNYGSPASLHSVSDLGYTASSMSSPALSVMSLSSPALSTTSLRSHMAIDSTSNYRPIPRPRLLPRQGSPLNPARAQSETPSCASPLSYGSPSPNMSPWSPYRPHTPTSYLRSPAMASLHTPPRAHSTRPTPRSTPTPTTTPSSSTLNTPGLTDVTSSPPCTRPGTPAGYETNMGRLVTIASDALAETLRYRSASSLCRLPPRSAFASRPGTAEVWFAQYVPAADAAARVENWCERAPAETVDPTQVFGREEGLFEDRYEQELPSADMELDWGAVDDCLIDPYLAFFDEEGEVVGP